MDPYNRIMRAAASGHGVRLSAEECAFMAMDDSIETAATNITMAEPIFNGTSYMSKDGICPASEDKTDAE